MKKILILILCVAFFQQSYGQKGQVGDTRWSFGFSFDVLDQFTPELDGGQTFKAPMDFGLRAFTWVNINSSVAVELGLSTNALRFRDIDAPLKVKNLHLFNFDGGIVYKFNNGYILKETSAVGPFLFVKARASYLDLLQPGNAGRGMGFGIPIGGGFNWRIADDVALHTSAAYTFGITDDFANDLLFSLGIMFDLGSEKVQEIIIEVEPEPEPIADADNDGIPDEEDDCPQVPGLPEFNGCPDTDGDGITDASDDCPKIAGVAAYNGCPDTDGDGIRDIDDDCPNEAGIASMKGCPVPDKDGDGVADSADDCPNIPGIAALKGCPDSDGDGVRDIDDSCPTEAGPASNKGCPVIEAEVIEKLEFAAKNIRFETGSAVIKTQSFSILDEVAEILKEWKNYHVSVDGHTDNVGSEASNQLLSEKRAQSAAAFLMSKGVPASRVSSQGYGESKPIGDNTTSAGRTLNRRVEFNLFIP